MSAKHSSCVVDIYNCY